MIWLGLVGSCVAYLFYFYLLHSVGPTRTATVTYTFPVIGIILGVIFLNESLDMLLVLGAGLVVASLVIVNQRRRR